jgi:ABC-type enterobactin transport system permease subunit
MTGNALFGATRPLLFLVNTGALYAYSEIVGRCTTILLFKTNRKGSLNSCFRAILVGIRRGLAIFRLKRLLKRRNKLKKSLIT